MCTCAFFIYKRPIRLIFIHEREQDCFVGRFLMHSRQMGSRLHSYFFFFFSFTGLNLKDITATTKKKTHIRSDQCLILKPLMFSLCLFSSLSLCTCENFRHLNLLPSWESLWHSSSWKSSTVKQPDLYTFLTCASAPQHMLDLCSPTHSSQGRVICYTPHFLSWSGEIRSGVETG